jgi:hypothetical protein
MCSVLAQGIVRYNKIELIQRNGGTTLPTSNQITLMIQNPINRFSEVPLQRPKSQDYSPQRKKAIKTPAVLESVSGSAVATATCSVDSDAGTRSPTRPRRVMTRWTRTAAARLNDKSPGGTALL